MNGAAATTAMIGTNQDDKRYGFPFLLLLLGLVFGKLRLDRVIPGGEALMYFPVLIIFLLGLYWLSASEKVLHNKQTKYILLFGLLVAIQIPFARHRGLAFSAFESFALFTVTSYLFKVQFIDTPFKWKKYVRLSILLSPFLALVGIFHKRVPGVPVLNDENDFALLMNTLVPVAFFLGQEARSGSRKAIYYGCALLFAVASIISFSRGGFIGLAAVGAYLLFKTPHKVTGFFVIVSLCLAVYAYTPQNFWKEVETIKTENIEAGTGKERIETWKAGWKMFIEHPIKGVGALNFGVWLPDYFPNVRKQNRMWGRVAHSVYFTVLPEMGLIGTLLFLGILWNNHRNHQFITRLEREKENLLAESQLSRQEREGVSDSIRSLYYFSLAYKGAMVAFLVTGIFISVLWYGYFWSITAAVVVTANLGRNLEKMIRSAPAEGLGHLDSEAKTLVPFTPPGTGSASA